MGPKITAAEQVGGEGLVRVQFKGAELMLDPDQLRILYALAESDWGWLPPERLAGTLGRRPADRSDASASSLAPSSSRPSSSKPPFARPSSAPQDIARLTPLVDTLYGWGLVSTGQSDMPPGGEMVALTSDGLALITALSRHWVEWQSYCRRFGLEHY